MDKNLLIVGAGIYGIVAYEIAREMAFFDKIDFVDDEKDITLNGKEVIGRFKDIKKLNGQYNYIIVAIGNSKVRLEFLEKIEKETNFQISTLISPKAYVSPSATIGKGSIIEPMAVIQSLANVSTGCIISANAVINHSCLCCEGVHIDCNATVQGYSTVHKGTKIKSGEVYNSKK